MEALYSSFIYIIFFILGLIIGSFLNVCVWRLPRGGSIIYPGSHCPLCSAPIRWYDNIPILSFLLLGGRCRSCGGRISFRYPLVELLTGLLFVAMYGSFGLSSQTLIYILLASSLLTVGFIDLDKKIIPNLITLPGIALGLIFSLLFSHLSLKDSLLGTILGGGILLLVGIFGKALFKKPAMGGGDVKLAAMIGAFLGWRQILLVLFLSFLLGAVIGTAVELIKGTLSKGRQIPFGPYIALSGLVAIFFGKDLINLYLGLF
jgi:leader peptidase (prepilin peptidase)/N-methyltransferase